MEITEILARLQDYLARLRRGWGWLLLGSLLLATLMVAYGLRKPTIYIASTLFHPEGSKSMGGQESALSLILGGGAEGGETGVMVGILESRRISESVTADTIEFRGTPQLMADIVLEAVPRGFSFKTWMRQMFADSLPPPTKEQKVVWAASQIRASMNAEITPEGFIKMNIGYYTPELAGLISREYIAKLRAYYKEQRTEKAWKNVMFFTARADSLKRELDEVSRSLARFYDRNQGMIYKESGVYSGDKAMQQEILKQMYVSLVLSKEQAMAQFQQDIPIIQVLDHPDPPYGKLEASVFLYLALGLIGGFFLAGGILVRKLLREDLTQLIQSQLQAASAEAPVEGASEEAEDPAPVH